MPAAAVRFVLIARLRLRAELAAEVLPFAVHSFFLAATAAMFTGHGSLLSASIAARKLPWVTTRQEPAVAWI
jgi:hypothetical protein